MKLPGKEDYPHPVPEGMNIHLSDIANYHDFICKDKCLEWPDAGSMMDDRVNQLLAKNFLIMEEARFYMVQQYTPEEIYEGYFTDHLINGINIWEHYHMFLKFSRKFYYFTFQEAVDRLKAIERICPVPVPNEYVNEYGSELPKIIYVTDIDDLSDVER